MIFVYILLVISNFLMAAAGFISFFIYDDATYALLSVLCMSAGFGALKAAEEE